MKNLMFILALAFFAVGCTKTKTAHRATSETGTFKFIPNWKTDTLTPQYNKSGHYPDLMYSFENADTSFVIYKSQKLYLFFIKNQYAGNYSDSAQMYLSCYISPNIFDTASAWSTCIIQSSRFWNASYDRWDNQRLIIMLNQVYPHFDTSESGWYWHY